MDKLSAKAKASIGGLTARPTALSWSATAAGGAAFSACLVAATIALLVAVIMPPPAEAWKLRAVPGADEEARARRDD